MRILYSHRIQSRDGQSVHVEELVTAFMQEGHEVRVVGPSFYQHAGFGGGSSTVAALRRLLPGALGELAELAYNIPAYLRLRRACREFRPDLIYERYNLYYLAGAWLARRTGLPYFLEVNSPLADERIRFGGLRLRRLAHALECRVWRSATRVLAVTGVLKDIIAAAGADAARIEVVPNGVVLDRFLPAPFAPGTAASRPLVLGFVGFVRSWHGLDAVIRAIAAQGAAAPPVSLVVIGEGPARADLEQLAAELGIAGRVRFTGLVDHNRVPDLVAEFDIALQPKVVAYASPLKIFDYMAAGRAIVAPDQPNIREILEHERTALLFDPAEDGALWRAIARLIDDPGLRTRLGAAARAELERRDYTWRGNARHIAARLAAARAD
ncbi:glycosyltransferase family 4 protein [Limobrevibacterium gyesilva]|uniref:Glycosyltransferase family 4 protein n=1 Tax=Limobrevibacterium gyesilva TaxID=2991712 RepID=A0AA42CH57_9PROT|nr:glycosyltransferase family 4 protein [Limobrevibacterium gyesilva]MCW3476881.1 glycosyltransferase family 4 protein [Limobrevibacterium gyesilva]